MGDPKWDLLRRAMLRQDIPTIRQLSIELNIQYVNDDTRNARNKNEPEPQISCSSCKHGQYIGDQGYVEWMCMKEVFQICRPDLPTASHKWEKK